VLDQPVSGGRFISEGPVVTLEGEIDLAVAPSLRENLGRLLEEGHCDIFVDLLDATFLDSIALGVLVGALEQCRASGGDLHLVVTEPRILRVLEITGLSNTFTIHSSRDALPGQSFNNDSGSSVEEVSQK
jgi:anti-sigma B factor antagonist